MSIGDELAYPTPDAGPQPGYPGLTKRELFAAMMQGFLSNTKLVVEKGDSTIFQELSQDCIGFAEALIEELSK